MAKTAARKTRTAPAARSPAANWREAAGFALLACSALLVYAPALHGDYLWDDENHVTQPALQSLHGLWSIWFHLGATQQYYPLLHTAFWLEHRLWGDSVFGYHLLNVLLHACSAALVVLIVRRLHLAGAWVAGFIFAMHPVCVEAVAWISEQKSALSTAFCLASALAYLRFADSRRKSTYWLASLLFVCALLSKTVTSVLPAALLVILWWREGRLGWKRDVVPLAPWIAAGASMGLVTAWVERTYIGASGNEFAMTFGQRILLASRIPWFYAAKLLWPANLVFNYPRWTIDTADWREYLYPAATLAAGLACALAARRNRGPLASYLLFTGMLFPALGFFNVLPFRYSYVADHFQYLAALGLIVPVSCWLASSARRLSSEASRAALAVALVILLAILSWRQSAYYKDSETLYREILARNPASWFAHNNLGTVLEDQPGRLGDAIAEFRKTVALAPDYPLGHFNLANALARLDSPSQLPEVIAEYRAALRGESTHADAHSNLADALARAGQYEDAVREYRIALQLDPDLAQARANFGSVLAQMGRLSEAIPEFAAAVRLEPAVAELRCNLGLALAQAGRIPEAIAEFETAVRLEPDLAEAHFDLAAALSQAQGRKQDAIAECQNALRISPDLEPARQLLRELTGER